MFVAICPLGPPLGDLGSSPSEHAQVNAITHYLAQFGPAGAGLRLAACSPGQWIWNRLPHPIEAVLTWAHSGRNE
jgi:hypothetical protein